MYTLFMLRYVFSRRSSDNKLVFLGLDYLGLGGGSSGAPALHRVTAAAASGDSSSGGSGSTITTAKAARRALVGDLLLVFDYDSEVGDSQGFEVCACWTTSSFIGQQPPYGKRHEPVQMPLAMPLAALLLLLQRRCSGAKLPARRTQTTSTFLFTRAPFLRSTRSSATFSLSRSTLEDIMFGRGEREKFRHDERKKRSRCA